MSALIDTLLPSWDVHEVHGIDVAAPPERTWAALEQVTVGELPLTRLLMGVRTLGRSSARDRTFLEAVGFLAPLAQAPGERVIGMVGRPWRLRPARAPISGAQDFTGFDEPGWVRIATDFRVQGNAGGSRLETETRIQATDAGARRRFARYWRIVGLGSALIRRDLLRATRRRAERSRDREGYLGLGSNVGDRRANLQAAVDALPAATASRCSPPPRSTRPSPSARCSTSPTSTTPASACGRRWSPRRCSTPARRSSASWAGERAACATGRGRSTSTCCCSGPRRYRSERLSLPHEQVTSRRFVLVPLLELAPGLVVPGAGPAADALAALGRRRGRAPRGRAARGGRRRAARLALAGEEAGPAA